MNLNVSTKGHTQPATRRREVADHGAALAEPNGERQGDVAKTDDGDLVGILDYGQICINHGR